MDRQDQAEARWPVDLEATVAQNLRWLRESRGLSPQQLGSDLALHGFGMDSTTVAQVELGARPLRLNEVAALAAFFQVPIESLWQKHPETPEEREVEREGKDEREAADQAADQERIKADYYSRQRHERLRDK